MTAEADINKIESAMANLEVSKVEAEKEAEAEVQAEKQDDNVSLPPESVNLETSQVEAKNESEVEVRAERDDAQENSMSLPVETLVEGNVDTVQAVVASGGSDEGSTADEDPSGKQDLEQNGKANKDVAIVLDATKLLEKLDVGESSDEMSSSMDSTANSGACHAGREDLNKGASSEDCSEEGASRPRIRIDLQHQIVREIVKIQHDRDEYEKQCKEQKETGRRSSSGSAASKDLPTPDQVKVEDVQVVKNSRTASFYRPPNLRNDTGAGRGKPPPEGLKITLDTQKQKRSIQLGSPPVVAKSESNFTITFDATTKERHVEVGQNSESNGEQVKSPGNDVSPSHFEFKATPVGSNANNTAENKGRRNMRGNGSFRAWKAFGNAPTFDIGSTPKRNNEKDCSPPAATNEEVAVPPLPPKDKPFAAELRWSDIVESEEESPHSNVDNASSSSTPDVLDSNQRNNNNSYRRRRQHRRKKPLENTPAEAEQAPTSAPTGTARRSVFERLEDTRPGKQRVFESSEDNRPARRSVFDRLGTRFEPTRTPPVPRLRTVQYEPERVHRMRQASEQEYYGEVESSATGGRVPRDTKQKRSGFELYVPRRGGAQS